MRTQKPLTHPLSLALLSAISAFVLALPSSVVAVPTHRISGAACVINGTSSMPDPEQSALGNGDLVARDVFCPIGDATGAADDGFTKASTVSLTVYYNDQNGNPGQDVTAQVCVTYLAAATPGGACDTTSTSLPGIGSFTVLSNSVWTVANASAFGYLYVSLPPFKGNPSTLRGYTVAK